MEERLMILTDTHAHYDDSAFDEDRDILLSSMPSNGVKCIINAAQHVESSEKCIKLAEKYDFIYATVGIHPLEANRYSPENMDRLRELSKHPKVVAIGETGLDYHYENTSPDIQKNNLKAHIELAEETGLPLVIHDREAHKDCVDILKTGKVRCVFHCYSGSAEMARELIKMDHMFSFGGAVTFKNAKRAIEALQAIPMSRIMIETDCPYMSPEPFRGKRNDSTRTKYVAEKIALVKGLYPEEVCEAAYDNMRNFYKGT